MEPARFRPMLDPLDGGGDAMVFVVGAASVIVRDHDGDELEGAIFLGTLDDRPCWAVGVEGDPEGGAVPLMALYGQVDEVTFTVAGVDADGNPTASKFITNSSLSGGQNFFFGFATNGQLITSITVESSPNLITDIQNTRVNLEQNVLKADQMVEKLRAVLAELVLEIGGPAQEYAGPAMLFDQITCGRLPGRQHRFLPQRQAQPADPPADGGMVEFEPPCRRMHAALARHFQKDLQIIPFGSAQGHLKAVTLVSAGFIKVARRGTGCAKIH